MKLGRISRIVRILTLLQSGHSYSVDKFASILGVSRRTFFRDMKELEAIGVPYHFDTKTGGYNLDPEYFLPSVDLTLQEALSLLLLVHKGRNHLPLPFKNSALLAGLKVENNLPAEIRRYCSASLAGISIKPDRHAPMDVLDRVFAQLQEAIRKNRKVKMTYHSLYEREQIDLTLCPYHLFYNHRAWYVVGLSSLHDAVRTFKLNRIGTLELQSERFVAERKFDIVDYLGKAWSMIPEGRLYHVRLRFAPKVAQNVSEVRWHCTQKTTWNDDGSVTMEFRVDGLGEISWWILGYGDQVEVLAPTALRKQTAATAKRMAKINR
jgi:proteasome accessory factor B